MTANSKMKLYGCKGCGSVAVEAILQLANIPYDYIEAIEWTPFKRHPDLEKLNPLGQIPVLVFEDGTVMTESAAMLLYFAEKIPGMIPTDTKQRAEFFRWMMFIPANMYAIYQFRDFPARWIDDEAEQTKFRDKTNERQREYWRIIESQLQPAPYALGDTMNAFDIYLAMLSRWSPGRKWIAEHCPKILSAVLKTEAHPVIRKVWEKHFE